MISVLINAYAVSPSWGSEQGVGWNMVTRIARSCKVTVITEGEWRDEIEAALLTEPCRDNITFHYLPVSDRIRRMCWRQGDYRFYFHYRIWQKRAFRLARKLMEDTRFDIIHQLNMVGFREPGYLWKFKDVPYVWGPVGGMELMPLHFLRSGKRSEWFFAAVKNILNDSQRKHDRRVRKALSRADAVVAATEGCSDFIRARYGTEAEVINETGCRVPDKPTGHQYSGDSLSLLWVGKFDSRKQLGLALEALASLPQDTRHKVSLNVVGTGTDSEVAGYKSAAARLDLSDRVVWHGKRPHEEVQELMRSSDALLFTSIMEATSTVVLEAIENNLPVICFDTCGFGSVVDETIGYKIKLTDRRSAAADFSAAILHALRNPELMKEKSAACSDRQERLSWDWKAARYIEIYKSLI